MQPMEHVQRSCFILCDSLSVGLFASIFTLAIALKQIAFASTQGFTGLFQFSADSHKVTRHSNTSYGVFTPHSQTALAVWFRITTLLTQPTDILYGFMDT